MVNNSTKINKMNNHFSPSLTDNNKKDRTTYDIENPGPGIALLTWENYVIDKRKDRKSFVDFGGIVDHHCLNFFFIILCNSY
jgi:hypothetical protein